MVAAARNMFDRCVTDMRPCIDGATVEDPALLLGTFESLAEECRSALATDETIDWSAVRTPSRRPGSAPGTITAGWTLLHALEHLREQVAHLQLTRQLWEARQE